jgi:hypothetical protein
MHPRRPRPAGLFKSRAARALPAVVDAADVEGVRQHAVREGAVLEDFDRQGLRIPFRAGRADCDEPAGLALVVERVRERSGIAPRLALVGERRARWQRGGPAVEVGDHVDALALDLESAWAFVDVRVDQAVAVVREQVAGDHHQPAVGVAAQDLKAAQARAAGDAHEDPVAREEEVDAQGLGQERGAEPFGLDERDSTERVPTVRVQLEAGSEHLRELLGR